MGRTLLLIFAHPDDETFLTGGVACRYSSDGTRVVPHPPVELSFLAGFQDLRADLARLGGDDNPRPGTAP